MKKPMSLTEALWTLAIYGVGIRALLMLLYRRVP